MSLSLNLSSSDPFKPIKPEPGIIPVRPLLGPRAASVNFLERRFLGPLRPEDISAEVDLFTFPPPKKERKEQKPGEVDSSSDSGGQGEGDLTVNRMGPSYRVINPPPAFKLDTRGISIFNQGVGRYFGGPEDFLYSVRKAEYDRGQLVAAATAPEPGKYQPLFILKLSYSLCFIFNSPKAFLPIPK